MNIKDSGVAFSTENSKWKEKTISVWVISWFSTRITYWVLNFWIKKYLYYLNCHWLVPIMPDQWPLADIYLELRLNAFKSASQVCIPSDTAECRSSPDGSRQWPCLILYTTSLLLRFRLNSQIWISYFSIFSLLSVLSIQLSFFFPSQ